MRIDYRIKTLVGLGKSLAILMVLLWLDRPTGEQELEGFTGYSRKTIRRYLKELSLGRYIIRASYFNGWVLTSFSRQMLLEMDKSLPLLIKGNNSEESYEPMVSVEDMQMGNNYPMTDDDEIEVGRNYPMTDDDEIEVGRNYPMTDDDEIEVGNNYPMTDDDEVEVGRNYPTVGKNDPMLGKNDPLRGLINLTTTTHISSISPGAVVVVNPSPAKKMDTSPEVLIPENGKEKDDDLDRALQTAGIYGKVRKELLCMPGLTPDIVRYLEETLKERKKEKYTAGLLVHCLRHLDLAELEEQPAEEDYRRYVRGKYAEFIQH